MKNQTPSRSFTPSAPRSRVPLFLVTGAAALILGHAPRAFAQTWVPGAGGSWATAANWTPATVPNAIGAVALFNPNNTANRAVTIDSGAAGFTVGGITFDLTGAGTFTNALNVGTASSNLKLNNGGAGVTITTMGTGTGNNTILVPLVFNELVTGVVNQTASTSGAGSLNLTAAISGPGGFTKTGDGLATFGTGAKTYTGATTLSGGRTRISLAASPTTTSSFTVNAGGQLTLISASSYTFGSGPLNLNGTGALTGPSAAFPGAIRNDTGLLVSISNAVMLQTDTLLHVQASSGTGANVIPTGSLTFTNTIGGPGSLTLTGPGSNADQGLLILSGANSYLGGTFINGGIVSLSGAAATLGSGNVTVDDLSSPLSIARLRIQAGVLDAIANSATLSLSGGGTGGLADENFADLGAGINEIVGGLMLGGVAQAPGTYGSTLSPATFQNDDYFTGTGIVTVVPEPGTSAMLLGSLGLLLGLRRRQGV